MQRYPIRVAAESDVVRPIHHTERSSSGQKVVVGVFCANAGFNGMALSLQISLQLWQTLTAGHAKLPLHQIKAGNRFCNRVLNLQARIHLHKVEGHAAIRLLLDDEFDRASADVTHRPRCSHGCVTHLLAHRLVHTRRRRFFQHLLMAPLH